MNDARQYAFYLSEQNINQLDAIRGIKSRSQCIRELIEDAFQYWDYQRTEEYYAKLDEGGAAGFKAARAEGRANEPKGN